MFTATPWMIYPQIMHKPALPWVFRRPTQESANTGRWFVDS